jgi:hypothetical protein
MAMQIPTLKEYFDNIVGGKRRPFERPMYYGV